MQLDNPEHEAAVREYLGRMFQSRKGRRTLAKRNKQIKQWKELQDVYGPILKPLDLGINAFKKMAREKLDRPYPFIVEYKKSMYEAYDKVVKGEA